MTPRKMTHLCAGLGAVWLLCVALSSQAEQPGATQPMPAANDQVDAKHRVSVAVARDRATLMHDLYESTLNVVHRHYFRNGKSTLPARALEDVFSEMESRSKVDARWIAVNTKAMSINHEPESEFEIQAAKEIASGKDHIELIEKGVYHRATAIPLSSACVGCHNGLLAPPPKSPRFAGLVISIPIVDE